MPYSVYVGRSAVNVNLLVLLDLFFDEVNHVLLDLLDTISKFPIGFSLAQFHVGFRFTKNTYSFRSLLPVGLVAESVLIGRTVAYVSSEASAIDIVQFHIGQHKIVKIQEILQRLER